MSSFYLNEFDEFLSLLSMHQENIEMPEAPKQGFLKGLFGGGPRPLDREELFGEASGKASTSLAKSVPGAAGLAALQVGRPFCNIRNLSFFSLIY
jgi:syntaxin-binding protein 5